MNIMAELWNEWARPETIQKAGKRVGVSEDGLSIKWMDQDKFEQAEAILNPPTPTKTLGPEFAVNSPEGVRRHSAAYWRSLYLQRTEQVSAKETYELENVPGLLPYKKVKPNETVRRKITDVHGSLKASEVREIIRKKEEEEQQKEERKAEKGKMKEETKDKFERCEQKCVCKGSVCEAISLRKCTVCNNIQKSQCNKKACKVDGEAPVMIYVAARKNENSRNKRKQTSPNHHQRMDFNSLMNKLKGNTGSSREKLSYID